MEACTLKKEMQYIFEQADLTGIAQIFFDHLWSNVGLSIWMQFSVTIEINGKVCIENLREYHAERKATWQIKTFGMIK